MWLHKQTHNSCASNSYLLNWQLVSSRYRYDNPYIPTPWCKHWPLSLAFFLSLWLLLSLTLALALSHSLTYTYTYNYSCKYKYDLSKSCNIHKCSHDNYLNATTNLNHNHYSLTASTSTTITITTSTTTSPQAQRTMGVCFVVWCVWCGVVWCGKHQLTIHLFVGNNTTTSLKGEGVMRML